MNAIALSPSRTVKKAVPAKPPAAAQVVQVEQIGQAESTAFGHAAGRHLVIDHRGVCWPIANVGDILDVDFDCRLYSGEGDYLIQMDDGAQVKPKNPSFSGIWMGVRTFGYSSHGLSIRERAACGGWEWGPFTDAIKARTTFLGKVHNIYRREGPANRTSLYLVGKLTGAGEHTDGLGYVELQPGEGRKVTISGMTGAEVRRLSPLMLEAVKLEISA